MVTVATGEMSDADADRAGLVSTHAYAMLDVKEIQVDFYFLHRTIIFEQFIYSMYFYY